MERHRLGDRLARTEGERLFVALVAFARDDDAVGPGRSVALERALAFDDAVEIDEQDRTPGADGAVDPLRLVGGGDPNLSGRAIPYRKDAPAGDPLAAIEDLADQVAAHGVRSVSADIVGDDTAYVWQPYADGWSIDDPVWDYGAPASALSVNDNTVSLRVLPGSYASDAVQIAVMPPVDYYDIDNRVRTAADGGKVERRIMVDRLPGARQLRIWGTLPLNDPGDTEVLGVEDPALFAAVAFRDVLARRGIAIRGEARAVHLYPHQVADLTNGPAPDPEPGVELALRDPRRCWKTCA